MSAEVKSSGIAIVCSFFCTGLGQLYAGHIGRGLIMMLLTPIVWGVSFFGGFIGLIGLSAIANHSTNDGSRLGAGAIGGVGIVLMFAAVAWWVWGMFDAKNLCDAHNRRRGFSR